MTRLPPPDYLQQLSEFNVGGKFCTNLAFFLVFFFGMKSTYTKYRKAPQGKVKVSIRREYGGEGGWRGLTVTNFQDARFCDRN